MPDDSRPGNVKAAVSTAVEILTRRRNPLDDLDLSQTPTTNEAMRCE